MSGVLALAQQEWLQQTQALGVLVQRQQENEQRGDGPRWRAHLDALPQLRPDACVLDADTIRIGSRAQLNEEQRAALRNELLGLHPWRKGPYDLFGMHIDTEWRSDWKWQRLAAGISDLHNRRVLDVGCGNGYHLWRMRAAGARCVIGIDPMLLFSMQFQAVAEYINDPQVQLLQAALEDWPQALGEFDTVFSMGVYYHRRDPLEHLRRLQALLRSGGELILETLVIEGDQHALLEPEARYAKMRNVYNIPSSAYLIEELQREDWRDVMLLDESATSLEEQRQTEWMYFESLADFLDPHDHSKTVEGHPAPRRAVLRATRA